MLYNMEINNKSWIIKEYDKKSTKNQTKSPFYNKKSKTRSERKEVGLFLNPYELLRRI